MPDTPNPAQPPRQADPASSGDTGRAPADTANTGGRLSADPDLRKGSRAVPEYVLLAKLGEGGFGQVWKARDDNGFEVALKFLRLDGRAGATELRSVELMRNVRHAHVLPMFRAWQVGNWLVLALELGDKTLYQRLAEAEARGQAGIPRRELLGYLVESAKALDYLHTLNIQHRDVKPQNLLVVGGSIKVADFGLAKLMEHSLASNSGAMTMAYAAPEQFQGLISPHSDQYSLAVSYCQLRGGKLPYRGGPQQLMFGHLQGEPDLSMLPGAERSAVAKALSKKPEQRWPSCRGFVKALAAGTTAAKPAEPPATVRTTTWQGQPRFKRSTLGGVALIGTVVAALAIALLLPGTRRPAPASDGIVKMTVTSGDSGHTAADPGKKPEPPTTEKAHSPRGDLPKPARQPAVVPVAEPLMTKPKEMARQRPQPLDCTGEAGVSPAEVRRAQEAWAKYLGRKVEESVEIADGVTMAFVLVPPGKFRMGSPESEAERSKDEVLHEVTLREPFYLGKYEVTQGQYRALVSRARSAELKDEDPSKFKGADLPVEQVSWTEADAFGRELTKLLSDKQVYRLPTKAEWEYSCRGGRPSSQPFGVGDGRTLSSREANFDGNHPYGDAKPGPYLQETCKVGSYDPNALGLYDMHGNVWEWCQDRYWDYPGENAIDPMGPQTGSRRVIRGGSWSRIASNCRSAHRSGYDPSLRLSIIGFRVALVPTGQ